MCLTGRYLGGLGCPVTRGAGGSSPSVVAPRLLPSSQSAGEEHLDAWSLVMVLNCSYLWFH